MPRNPDKTRCQVPNCRNWAMRGHARCRAHRDLELGPRPLGAPTGNLNALKTGQHAHPFPQSQILDLAREIVDDPDLLPAHLSHLAQSVQSRTRDPYQALVALRVTLSNLESAVAQHQFLAELRAYLERVPPDHRDRVAALILKPLSPLRPQQRLFTFQELVAQREARRRSPPAVVPNDKAAPS